MPLALQYSNAWDHVPAIQKYATRLMRPPMPAAPAPVDVPSSGSRRRKQNDGYPPWDDMEESSRDGDAEDEESDSDRSTLGGRSVSSTRDSDGGNRTVSSPTTSIAPPSIRPEKSRSRRGSRASTSSVSKDYKSQGTQTPGQDMRDHGVQAMKPKPKTSSDSKQLKDAGMLTTPLDVPLGCHLRSHAIPTSLALVVFHHVFTTTIPLVRRVLRRTGLTNQPKASL
ncbi:hypothetical protein BKA62DRAFT_224026 [Auriculariales sp. MPI-PUGE-AT-0066]|nr:hypothetical protein BKA62DRAFT_224026 [Auriculariales sp. MPI-PUGE-AT-0066]